MVVTRRVVSARVFQERSGWDMPSINPECCVVQCTLRFAQIPYEVAVADPGRNLPVVELIFGQGPSTICDGLGEFMRGMKDGGYDVDRQLTMVQKSEAAAFRSLIQDADLARILEWWIDKENFRLGLKSLLEDDYRFPMSEIYPRWRRSKVLHERRLTADEDEISFLAEDAYGCLESRLGRRDWFFGEHPTTVDAFVFGYFGCASSGQIPDGKLSEMLSSGFPSLTQLVKRIKERYFNTPSSANFVQPQVEPRKSKTPVRSPEEQQTWKVSMRYAAGMMMIFFGYIYLQSETAIEFI
mmetsp:Transcript_43569/g.170543  ORF Transcript_43569/g.170543 Transcript_43569/m.170543 type:complete len:297 (-) Transcript_43569:331-1221(-)|eukprot:CAMPEP_0113965932 /NCGR_PEP_ID=MMETSP0011_2-20120614/8037_1 /TAXON_ID=101924 /ORGANISM="Rhodosorus marinus" /LENGTH=296 /DNA_ID=CAMNT_0000978535 /DNA_START=39 /DNA_END=929 /DNA_ORIENTATION=- /assembly_acc=CAM_ASM_000156